MTILFKELIIRPALKAIDRWSQAYENLIFMTFVVESNEGGYFEYGREGGGIGPYNITDDMYASVLKFLNFYNARSFKEICLCSCFYSTYPSTDALIHNLRWATIVVYLHYFSKYGDKEMPRSDDIEGIALLYTEIYKNKSSAQNELFKAIEMYHYNN